MTTQLRLVDPPPARRPARAPRPRAGEAAPRPARGRVTGGRRRSGTTRRGAAWGEWDLDARTRTIGRAGVAAARAALERAASADVLPRAS